MSRPEVSELILCDGARALCETYIFEPGSGERNLGQLFAVAEVYDAEGHGPDILERVISAMQREYYRDPERGVLPSFESGLHQANLVLHELEAQGWREWMHHFHLAIGVLAGSILHVSVAGEALVLLHRRSHSTNISYGLAQTPLTNPLRAFSQVASGTTQEGDVLFFGTPAFDRVFPESDVRQVVDQQSAEGITTSLAQFYRERIQREELAVLTVVILPESRRAAEVSAGQGATRAPLTIQPHMPRPRMPLLIRRTRLQHLMALFFQVSRWAGSAVVRIVWPWVRAAGRASQSTGSQVSSRITQWKEKRFASAPAAVTREPWTRRITAWPKRAWSAFRQWMWDMPTLSKLFIGLTVVLGLALVVSLVLLQNKRTEDASIQRASELLHEARTKQEAAATALIYQNRSQAQTLLGEAQALAGQVEATTLYAEEVAQLKKDIQSQFDSIQHIARVTPESLTKIGDFNSVLSGENPPALYFVNGTLFSYNPATNAVVRMGLDGKTDTVIATSQGVGFFQHGVAQEADKQIIFLTSEPDIAVVDARQGSLSQQDIALPAPQVQITALAPYGSRLYIYDATTHNIYAYDKTLRGYSAQQAWVKDTTALPRNIVSMAIDGSLYTLQSDGTLKEFFKGEAVSDFTIEAIEPALTTANTLFTSPDHSFLYVLDTHNNRVVIFTKQGALERQIVFDGSLPVTASAVASDEKNLYILSGSNVYQVPLD